jgi:citrate lyase subunit beta/citryl-CoA lyase
MNVRARRSCLAVPASNAHMMGKAAGLEADEVFFDLEDGCAPSEKKGARTLALEALKSLDFGDKTRAVRINQVGSSWVEDDLVELVPHAAGHLDAIIVPKVETAEQVRWVETLLSRLAAPSALELELQIESAKGAVNLREIATASARTTALVFGPGDYAASMGIPQREIGISDDRYPGHQWHWIMCEIVVHARAAGLQAIDGPYADFRNAPAFRESALRALLLGYDGKWCIHPEQLAWANEAFSPTADEVASAKRVLAAYEEGLANGKGAIALDGKLVDEASRRLAEVTVARARSPRR